MPEPRFRMKKIWDDSDFYEVNLCLFGNGCNVDMDIYLGNDCSPGFWFLWPKM